MDKDTLHLLNVRQARAGLVEARARALGELRSAPHRMEFVGTIRGVEYINDSRATFLDAALQSLASIEKPVLWITGDLPEGLADGAVLDFLRDRVRALILCTPGMSDVPDGIREALGQAFQAGDLRTAVFLAHELAASGEVVLFSPACPSGGGFANYEERGHAFKRTVREL
ncbi:MAG: hypothetical protein JNJ64_11235 [Flavobacteriales bacterium]|nr:hypothetical protein [Flavobacteriales bacterium]